MAAKKKTAVLLLLQEEMYLRQRSLRQAGVGVSTLRRGLREGFFDFGYVIRSEKGEQHRFYCPDRLVYLKTGYYNPKPDQTNEEV